MEVVSDTRCRDGSQDSRGEGTSRDKGKTVDARNWGAADIPEGELDLDAQCRKLELYSVHRSINENILDGYNSDEQREMLEYWKTQRAEPSGHEDRLPVLRDTTVVVSRAPSPSQNDGDAVLCELTALRSELAQVRQASQTSRAPPVAKGKGKSQARVAEMPDFLTDESRGQALRKRKMQNDSRPRNDRHGRASSLRPVAQLAPGSYLGIAFDNLAGGDPSSSSSDSSSSSESSSDTGGPGGDRSSSSDTSGSDSRGSVVTEKQEAQKETHQEAGAKTGET